MTTHTWHFPEPMKNKPLTREEEKQLFYTIAEGIGDIFGEPVRVNADVGHLFEKKNGNRMINYSGKGLTLYTRVERNIYLEELFPYEDSTLFIADFFLTDQNTGMGTKLMKYLLKELQKTSIRAVTLHSENENSTRFWSRLGFKPMPGDTCLHGRPYMYLMLPKNNPTPSS
ncbi:GNAT family N-acetyltransferase [Cytobacillus sp. FJAT-54145]|uniref:GNAT family N-acetyltransferase n=1 Tax=Cytobacillus spartinae TaxID=3299023 RepID=A0ABW6KAN3_9BACI